MHEVVAEGRPREEADPALEALRVVARVLEGGPGALEEESELGVQDLGLPRAEAEKGGVEELHLFQDRPCPDVIRIGQQLAVLAGLDQLLL